MIKSSKLLSLLLVMMMVITSLFTFTLFAKNTVSARSLVHKPGETAFQHMKVLSDEIGPRVAGTKGESDAKEYIYDQFQRMGYEPITQHFSFVKESMEYSSSNIIAVKPGKSSEVVIVGGHYDSVSEGQGADDSASGIAVIMQVAEVLKNIKTPYTIKFVAFGAEEAGLKGSKYYVSQMSKEDIENTVAMINLDSLAAGDKMYIYGDLGADGWVREQALNIAKRLKLNLETNPGLNEEYPAGTTGLWSDHAPFVDKGIPYGYFEATNWELGEFDGYTQTVKDGEIWHSEKDTISYIESNYPGRIEERLSTFSQVLSDLIKFMNKTSIAKQL